MVFSSLFFLYGFLPVCILLYTIARGMRAKNAVLMVLSLLFYAWGEPLWVVLLLFSAALDYTCGKVIGRARARKAPLMAKAALAVSITANLSLLATFKYLDFFIENLGLLLRSSPALPGIALPIGISFYTFQTMSYTIDVYRDKVGVQKSFLDFLLFVSLFPQLIAGPILRYSDLERQLSDRPFTWEGCAEGVTRFCCGLGKKVLLANTAGSVAAGLLDGSLTALPAADAWLGILLYTAQIYFDFSGYSDMAIGLGSMFGFKYGENFRYPYYSMSVTDFWRRWHISLGSFFRDYVYIPLGGSKRKAPVILRNLLIVWTLTGLWHGASWNFVLWGLYYFLWLALERFVLRRFLPGAQWLGWIYTFPAVVLGWVLFYFTDMSRMGAFFSALFGANGFSGIETASLWIGRLPLIVLCAAAASPLPLTLANRLRGRAASLSPAFSLCYNTAVMTVCTIYLAAQSYNPFLYFRF